MNETPSADAALYKGALDALADHIALVNSQGTILAVNISWQRFGETNGWHKAAESVGSNYFAVCEASGNANALATAEGIRGVLSGARSSFSQEYPCDGPSGVVWYTLSVARVTGNPNVAVVAHTNITARKRAEEQVRKRGDELAHAARFAILGEMVFGLAHELNQPLAAVTSSAEAGIQRLQSQSAQTELMHTFEFIVSQTQRSARIIHRLRHFVRKDQHAREVLSVNEIIHDVLELMAYELREGQVLVQLDLDSDVPGVEVDRVQLEQVTVNLIQNALDAMGSSSARSTLTIRSLCEVSQEVQVDVCDNGEGIQAENVNSKLFEPFYTTREAGMGLGLSICQSITVAHGGRIWASANPDRGATFHFAVPAHTHT